MLDTSVIMMQQYNAAAALSMPMPRVSPNGDVINMNNVPSTSATNTEEQKVDNSNNEGLTISTPVLTKLKTENLCTNDNITSNLSNEEIAASTSTNLTDSQLPMTKDEEIRKRRLERFQ